MLATLALAALSCQTPAAEPSAARFPSDPGQDALRYRLILDVDVDRGLIHGTVEYRFRAVSALDRIRLDARPSSDAWRVAFLRDGEPLQTTWSGQSVEVLLGESVAAGSEVTFTATLEGRPPGGFSFTDNRYGERLAFTDHYSIRARSWLPCVDHPGDRAAFETHLTYPAALRALASGTPVGGAAAATTPSGAAAGRALLVHATRSDIPPYMYAIVIGPFAEVVEEGDDRLRPHLIYARDVAAARRSLVHHAAWLRIMEETFGPYAYGKYRVVQCPTRWGGFEAPGNVQLSESIFEANRDGVGTLAHELTHMWFGDAVGYSQWREVWLSEGFASYFGPWLHAQTGGPALADSMAELRDRWRRSREGRTRTVRWDGFSHPDLALNANTYPKGAWILHMLRGELGDAAFFAAIRDYYVTFSGSSVVTRDFVDSVRRSTDRDLTGFFAQWLDRKGCPELRVSSNGAAVIVEQVQPGEPYRFRLPLGWTDAKGGAHKQVWEVQQARTVLTLDPPPSGVPVIDPDVELLFRAAR